MIRAKFLTEPDGGLYGFQITGHSGAADAGEDVICAAVSSAAYLTANTITEIIRADADVRDGDGFMQLRVAEKNVRDCRILLEGFKLHLLGLEEQYPKNIHVSYMEV